MSDDSESHDAPRLDPAASDAPPGDATPSETVPKSAHDDEPLVLESPIDEADDASNGDLHPGSPESDEDDAPPFVSGFSVAIGFLTRLPFGSHDITAQGALARSMGLFPLVGVVVGGIGGAIYALAHLLLPSTAAALLAMGGMALVTGALHEDGLADTVDGFGGGRDRAGKLEIMRDSRIGTFGTIALMLVLGLRAVALAEIGVTVNDFGGSLVVVGALIAAHALARAAIPVAMQALVPARGDGLGAGAGQPSPTQTGIAVVLAMAIAALVLPVGAALAALAGATLGTILIILWAQSQIGGHTGDVLGAVEQVAETLALLGVLAAL